MAPSALPLAAMVTTAAATATQMRGEPDKVAGTTIAISTDAAMYFRNASMRGVIGTRDMIQTPPMRVAKVTRLSSSTAPIAAHSSTMPPRPDDAAGQRTGDDVPARRQQIRASERDRRRRDPRQQVGAALPLSDDDRREVGDHHRVEAEPRQVAEQRAGGDADRRT